MTKEKTTVENNDKPRPPRKFSAETRAKISAARKGKAHSAETRAKISAARKGKAHSAETREKISEAKKGKTISAEARAKMSASHKGKTISAATRAKMSEAQKLRFSGCLKPARSAENVSIPEGLDTEASEAYREALSEGFSNFDALGIALDDMVMRKTACSLKKLMKQPESETWD